MPIYADEVPFNDLRKMGKYHVCAECGALLRLSWSNDRNCYMLRCERFEEHNGIRRLGRDPEIDEIRNKLKGEPLPMETTALQKLDPKGMLDRVNQARFPKDLTVVDRTLIAKISIEYGLDPLFGELMIYQGRPYVTIDARRRKAQETDLLDGINARPANKQEKQARGVPPEDYLFVAEVWVKGCSHPFEGWGRVREAETKGDPHLPIVKDPAAQAEKRAEAQALRRGFHLPLPSFEEIVEGEFTEVTDEKGAPKSKPTPSKAQPSLIPPTPKGNITQPQRQKVWGDAMKMGYTDDDVHSIIKVKFGMLSINDLSIAQASDLIDMIGKGERITSDEIAYSQQDHPELWEKGEE